MAALLVAVGAVFFGATIALAAAHFVRAARAASDDDAGLVAALKKLPQEARLQELARRARPGRWEHRLAAEALAADSAEARVATVNDVLGDLSHTLGQGDAWPKAAVRLSVAWGLLLACLAIVLRRMDLAIALVVLGAASALAAAELGRRARAHVQGQREAVDLLVTTVLGVSRSTIPATRPRRRSRT